MKINFKNFVASVEERTDGIFVSTLWDKNYSLENDRSVVEFETKSAALAHMYETLFNKAKESLRDIADYIDSGGFNNGVSAEGKDMICKFLYKDLN